MNLGHINQFADDYSFEGKTKRAMKLIFGPVDLFNAGKNLLTPKNVYASENTPTDIYGQSGWNAPVQQGGILNQSTNVAPYGKYGTGGGGIPNLPFNISAAGNAGVLGANTGNRNTGNREVVTSGTSGTSGGGQADVDAIYNPIRDFLNQMESEYTAQQPQAEADVGASYERGLTPINEQEQTQLASQNKMEGTVNTSEQNALAQARQVYNELQQRNVSLYGTGSSAGPAASEVLGRQTAKTFGDVSQQATLGRTAIDEERGVITKFAAQKRTDLAQQKEEAIRNVQKEFRAGLMQINQMRAQNESAKASARLELLQQAQQQAFQIEQANTAYARAIDQFEREKSATLASNAAFQSNQQLGPDTVNAINQILSNPQLSKSQKIFSIQQIAPGYNGTQLFGGIPTDKEEEDGNLKF